MKYETCIATNRLLEVHRAEPYYALLLDMPWSPGIATVCLRIFLADISGLFQRLGGVFDAGALMLGFSSGNLDD